MSNEDAELEILYTAEDGREIYLTPKVTWDDLDKFFDEQCDHTYISSLATKFIDLEELYDDKDFKAWAHEHWLEQGNEELKRIADEEREEYLDNLQWAVDLIDGEIDDTPTEEYDNLFSKIADIAKVSIQDLNDAWDKKHSGK